MATSNFDSIFVAGMSLRPAPFVSTSYEYNKSGEYVIGGLLIVTLSGSLVSETIDAEVAKINSLQADADCITLKIGCSGGSDFLDGTGRIRTVTFSQGNGPYSVNYSMVIAIETIKGAAAVNPDPSFIQDHCLSEGGQKIEFLQNYTEKLSFIGEASAISSVDNVLDAAKSYIKISGEINVSSYGRTICGKPSYSPTKNSEDILKRRATSLLSLDGCNTKILDKYKGWNKWLDTKKLTINIDGSLTWSFDMYLSQGGGKPYAWIDFNTEEKIDQKTRMKNKVLSGVIKGLSQASVSDYLENKATANERIANADNAYNASLGIILNGDWHHHSIVLYGNDNAPPPTPKPFCYQRLSSNVKRSVVAGEISFKSEFGDINSCSTTGVGNIDVTIEETFSAIRYKEFIIPNSKKAIVQKIAPSTPKRLIITGKGVLNGCDKKKMSTLANCVDTEIDKTFSSLPDAYSLILLNEKKNIMSTSYTITKEYISCEQGALNNLTCTTNTKPIYK